MASRQTIQVGLQFTADTSQAKAQLSDLKNSISSAISTQNLGNMSAGFNNAVQQAATLRGILEQATTETGKLDLSKFQRGLTQAGLSMTQVKTALHTIGQDQAFTNLANQIAQADTRSQLLTGNLKKFAQSLKNTAVWTVQSTAIHAVQSALRGAFNYAKQLNKGLTDIAIVSDLTTQQLADFAKQANTAAKALSTTTNEYVKGALIYYQQGLNTDEVNERVATTIKMANASGESAEAISSYMTAIWNNFADGSKEIEYYADVIAYLGAKTAASNDEIAEGMRAFSAVANTVGLSYEYAASALTTLVAQTRQSASTVGNSLKTIFGRLSSLKLGETLEDGVGLTKYTKALESVGVNVLDINGNLKQMDDILDELGARWKTLSQEQQAAVAQTVGGIRQYNNLIALLDNYDYFKGLVAASSESEGFLQSQQEEYAASWEAANNRLKASFEELYSKLINDEFFIKLTNFGSGIVKVITDIIKGMGGVKGLISAIIMALTSGKMDKFALNLDKMAESIRFIKDELTGLQKQANVKLQNDTLGLLAGSNIKADDNKALFEAQDRLTEKIQYYNQLKADGNIKDATTLGAVLEREINQFNMINDTSNAWVEMRQKIFEVAEATGIEQDELEAVEKGASRLVAQIGLLDKLKQNSSYFNTLKGMDPEQLKQLYGNITPALNKAGENGANAFIESLQRMIKARSDGIRATIQEAIGNNEKTSQLIETITKADSSAQDDYISGLIIKYQELANEKQTLANKDEAANKAEIAAKEAELKSIEQIIEALIKEQALKGKSLVDAQTFVKSMSQKPLGETPSPMSLDLQSVARALSSITMMSSAMDGLVDNFKNLKKEGTLSITSLISSLGSLFMSSSMFLKAMPAGVLPSILTGPAGPFILMGIVALLKIIFGWVEKLIKQAKANSLEGQLKTVNKALEQQNEIVKNLNTAYSDLESTISSLTSSYDKLVAAEKKFGKNDPRYLLALEEYNKQIDELVAKYGKGILGETDSFGRRTIDEKAFSSAKYQELISAQALQRTLSDKKVNLEAQIATEKFNNQYSADNDYEIEQTGGKSFYSYNVDTKELKSSHISEALYREIIEKIKTQLANGEEIDLSQYEDDLGEAGLEYFNKVTKEYTEILAKKLTDLENGPNPFKDAIAKSGLYGFAEKQGVGSDKLEAATEGIIQDKIDSLSEEDKAAYIDTQKQRYADDNENIEYREGKLYSKNEESGEFDTEFTTLSDNDFLRNYIEGMTAALIAQSDPATIESILAKTELPKTAYENYIDVLTTEAVEGERLAGATNDIETLELDADEVKAVADEIDHLTHAEEELPEAQQQFSKATKDNAGSLKKLAVAAEQTQKGYDALEKGYVDWYKAIKSDDELAKAKAMTELKASIADIIDVSDELEKAGMSLGTHFGEYLEENQQVVENALAGDRDAILELQRVAAEDIAIQLGFPEGSEVYNQVSSLMGEIQGMLDTNELKLGAVDNTALLQSLEQTINAMTNDAQVAQAIAASMGFDAEFDTAEETTVSRAQYWQPPVYKHRTIDGVPSAEIDVPGRWVTEEAPVTQQIGALKIKTADYVGGGNILAAKGGTGAGKQRVANAKGKGGGGGSKKGDKAERYHEINDKLDETSKVLKEISTYEDRAYGKQKLDYMNQNIEALKRQADQYAQLNEEARQYLANDKAILEQQYQAQFNDDGTIANFDEWYNKYKDLYESGKMSDEAYDAFKEAVKNYEDSLDQVGNSWQNYIDSLNNVYDKLLEEVEYALKYQNELIDDNLELLDYMLKKLADDGYDAADAIALLSKEMGEQAEKMDNYKEAIEGVLEVAGADESQILGFLNGTINLEDLANQLNLTEEAIDDLRKYRSELLKLNETMRDLADKVFKELTQALDRYAKEAEKALEKTDNYADRLEHLKNVIDIIGKDALGITGELLDKLTEASYQNSLRQIEIARTALEEIRYDKEQLQKEYEDALARGEMDDELQKHYDELFDDLAKREAEAVKRLAEKEEAALQAATEVFQQHLSNIVENFESAMSGAYKTLDNLQDAFERQKKLNELFVDDYQKIHDLSKLNRDIQKSLDATDNVKAMEYLRDLQQEVNDGLKEGNKLTEYDIGFLERKYQLRLAEIALEEAQNAKSKVRMTRTSEGDWSYTYYADEADQGQAQQNYEDKLYELEEYNQNRIKAVQDEMMQELTAYRDMLAGLNVSDEERAQMLSDYYLELQDKYSGFLNKALSDGHWIEDEFDVIDHNLINDWDETVLAHTTGFETLEGYMSAYVENSQKASEDLGKAYEEWGLKWQEVLTTAGDDATDFGSQVDEETTGIIDDGKEVVKEYDERVKEQKILWDKALEDLDDFVKDWNEKIAGMMTNNEQIASGIQGLITEYSKLEAQARRTASAMQATNGGGTAPSGPGNGSGGKGGGGNTNNDDTGWSWKVIDENGGFIASGGGTLTKEVAKNAVKTAASMYARAYNGQHKYYEDDSKKIAYAQRLGENGGRGTGGGCFAPGTKIIMSDLTIRNIEDIQINDRVIAYNDETGMFEPRTVIKSYPHFNTPAMIKVTLSNGIVMNMTPGHPLLSVNGWKSRDIENSLYEHNTVATLLNIGDEIIGFKNNGFVVNIEQLLISEDYISYNIEVETCHTFIANGMVVHNAKMNLNTTAMMFDTGGYTGEWGNSGRIAMLHQKELVLNQEDTSNILQSVNMVRNISDQLLASASMSASGLGQLASAGIGAGTQFEQVVNINAEFPNAVYHDEIKQAFDDLLGRTTQFLMRK